MRKEKRYTPSFVVCIYIIKANFRINGRRHTRDLDPSSSATGSIYFITQSTVQTTQCMSKQYTMFFLNASVNVIIEIEIPSIMMFIEVLMDLLDMNANDC